MALVDGGGGTLRSSGDSDDHYNLPLYLYRANRYRRKTLRHAWRDSRRARAHGRRRFVSFAASSVSPPINTFPHASLTSTIMAFIRLLASISADLCLLRAASLQLSLLSISPMPFFLLFAWTDVDRRIFILRCIDVTFAARVTDVLYRFARVVCATPYAPRCAWRVCVRAPYWCLTIAFWFGILFWFAFV